MGETVKCCKDEYEILSVNPVPPREYYGVWRLVGGGFLVAELDAIGMARQTDVTYSVSPEGEKHVLYCAPPYDVAIGIVLREGMFGVADADEHYLGIIRRGDDPRHIFDECSLTAHVASPYSLPGKAPEKPKAP